VYELDSAPFVKLAARSLRFVNRRRGETERITGEQLRG
jgi:hypothetical protein